MLKNYLKIAWRNLLRQPGFTMLNILGLAIGMAGCLFLVLYVKDEFSFDQFHEKAERVYRMELARKYPGRSRSYAMIPSGYANAVREEYPGVEATCRLFNFGPANRIYRYGEETWQENNVIWADSTFFRLFDLPLLQGDPQRALGQPNSIILTETMAAKYFGTNWSAKSVLGQVVEEVQNPENPLTVTGIIKDVPHNSHLAFDFLVSSSSLNFLRGEPEYISFSSITYLLLDEQAQPERIEAGFPDLVAKYASGPILQRFGVDYATYQQQGNGYEYSLRQLPNIYLDAQLEAEIKASGSRDRLYFFSLIAVLIIAIASINFINLSTARSAGRAREVGIRKTLGSERSQLVLQFLFEALLISSIAAGLALVLVGLGLPWFNDLTEKVFTRSLLLSPFFVGLSVGMAVLTGLASGLYPAFFLSSFRPIEVLQGKLLSNTRGGGLRNALVVCQFAISIFLIVATILIYQQLEYTQNTALGFDKTRLLTVENTGTLTAQQTETLLQEIRDLPGVNNASSCSTVPGQAYFGISFQAPGSDEMSTGSGLIVDDNYVSCLQMELVAGREFSPDFADSTSLIINEAAVRELGLTGDPIGQQLTAGDDWLHTDPANPTPFRIVGVLKDFHFQSLHHDISPLFLVHTDKNFRPGVAGQMTVRLAEGDPQTTLAQLDNLWERFQPNVPLSYRFLDREWAKLYTQEATARRVFVLFTLLAISIACLGLFGLAAYLVEKRRKEIGIRKVLGAETSTLVGMLSKDFLRLVLLALFIASPVAYYFMNNWLQDFAYRITISPWVFALAGSLALFIAFLTVGLHSLRAALANPVEALKSE
ncbi:MAG: ABC transporter permease [Bacteroidota bacterium]